MADAGHGGRTPRLRPWQLVLLGIAILVAVGLGMRLFAGGGGARSGQRPKTAVSVARATAGDMPVTVSALGTVQPVVTATVRTQLAGTLFRLMFRDGQMVRAGEVLAQIDPRPYALALAQARANLARDQAQLAGAQVDLGRYQTLLKQDSIASQQVDTQHATVRQLTGTVAADRAAIGSASLNLSYASIRAPVSGRAGLRQVDIGNYLTPADANGIVAITQVDPIDVTFALPQAQLGAIGRTAGSGAGLPVTALDQNGGQPVATGTFSTFDNQVDATTGTVKAKARFANGAGTLFPGEFVNVKMLVETLHGVVTVPVSAVRHGVPGDFVFVLQPDLTVKLTKVRTGPDDGGRIAILSGLAAGATVVVEGADGLDDGSAVRLPGTAGTGGKDGGDGKEHGGRRGRHGS